MRLLVVFSVSCVVLANVTPPLLESTPAPATPAPSTMIPSASCSEAVSPLHVSFRPESHFSFIKCWTFQCTGRVHMTFQKKTLTASLSLLNSNDYELTSLRRAPNSYVASHAADGDMKLVLTSNPVWYYDLENTDFFTVEWECEESTPVPPAVGFAAADYLTLPPEGTYKRLYSRKGTYGWVIPCTGTLDIEEYFSGVSTTVLFINNGVEVLQQRSSNHWGKFFSVDGNFVVKLIQDYDWTHSADGCLTLSWSCNGESPPLPPLERRQDLVTPVPATGVPPTFVPAGACLEAVSPLDASFYPKEKMQDALVRCWTFQCMGTVHITFLDHGPRDRLTLLNSNGYELLALKESRDRYTASFPANGELMLVHTNSWVSKGVIHFTVEWECEESTPVPPAVGFDAADYLTLPPEGTYKRLYIRKALHRWIIPCTGTLSVAGVLGNVAKSTAVSFFNNKEKNSVFFHQNEFNTSGDYLVDGNFIIELDSFGKWNAYENFFYMAWSCNGVLPQLPLLEDTSAPATPAPPTMVPYASCLEAATPLHVSFDTHAVTKCWTFQCVGTAHMTFLETEMREGLLSFTSNRYELTTLSGSRKEGADGYTASYPVNGNIEIVFNYTDRYYVSIGFTVEWVCEESTPVPPALGFDAADYLTLPPVGTYKRRYIKRALHRWIIPCTGTLSVEGVLGKPVRGQTTVSFINNETVVFQQENEFNTSSDYLVDGNFIIELNSLWETQENFFMFSWRCGDATALPTVLKPVFDSPRPVTVTPPTSAPTALPTVLNTAVADSPGPVSSVTPESEGSNVTLYGIVAGVLGVLGVLGAVAAVLYRKWKRSASQYTSATDLEDGDDDEMIDELWTVQDDHDVLSTE